MGAIAVPWKPPLLKDLVSSGLVFSTLFHTCRPIEAAAWPWLAHSDSPLAELWWVAASVLVCIFDSYDSAKREYLMQGYEAQLLIRWWG
jgi:hypothetical protein